MSPGDPHGYAIAFGEPAMNQSVHQLLHLILQGFTWFLRTIETLWIWSWSQITSAFNISWGNLPAWKLAVGLIAMAILAFILVTLFRRALAAFGKIAAAFWTMAVTAIGILAFVVMAGLFSRGVQWVVASVPDHFWDKFL
jgi:Na+/melibiose symporter-like transporter